MSTNRTLPTLKIDWCILQVKFYSIYMKKKKKEKKKKEKKKETIKYDKNTIICDVGTS